MKLKTTNNIVDSNIDFNTEMTFNNNATSQCDNTFKIYIVNYDITWINYELCCLNQFSEFQKQLPQVNNFEYIKWTFDRLNIGYVSSCKFIANNCKNAFRIEVIFDILYDNITSKNFYNNLIDNLETRIVHDEPNTWVIRI